MKRIIFSSGLLGLLLFILSADPGKAQNPRQICVLGSSTSWGYFGNPPLYPADSSWPNKIKKYYKNLGIIDTLFNLSVIGTDPYHAMPSTYIPPPGRDYPNPLYNITRAVNLIPKPDVIIVNFPTNHYDYFSLEEVINCFKVIRDSAMAKGIPCYIATTQPRNTFSPAEKLKLKNLRDLIMSVFEEYAIDFYTDLVEESTLNIDPLYSLGDNVHINAAGHTVLYNKVVQKNIFFGIIPVVLSSVKAMRTNDMVIIDWNAANQKGVEKYIVERSSDGINFRDIGEIDAGLGNKYTYHDMHSPKSLQYYRIKAKTTLGQNIYSQILVVNPETIFETTVYPTITSGQLNISCNSSGAKTALLNIMDITGRSMMKREININGNGVYPLSVALLPPGNYVLMISANDFKRAYKFIRQ